LTPGLSPRQDSASPTPSLFPRVPDPVPAPALHMLRLCRHSPPTVWRSQVLTLLKLGVEDLVHFDFMDPPAPETLARALEELNYLGAISDEGHITKMGHRVRLDKDLMGWPVSIDHGYQPLGLLSEALDCVPWSVMRAIVGGSLRWLWCGCADVGAAAVAGAGQDAAGVPGLPLLQRDPHHRLHALRPARLHATQGAGDRPAPAVGQAMPSLLSLRVPSASMVLVGTNLISRVLVGLPCRQDAAKRADEAKAQFAHVDGDHLTLLNAYHAYKQEGGDKSWCYDNFINSRSMASAENVRSQLERYGTPPDDHSSARQGDDAL
jgi:hypothetical protein